MPKREKKWWNEMPALYRGWHDGQADQPNTNKQNQMIWLKWYEPWQ